MQSYAGSGHLSHAGQGGHLSLDEDDESDDELDDELDPDLVSPAFAVPRYAGHAGQTGGTT